jgi:lipopolysaccharide export system permease protein
MLRLFFGFMDELDAVGKGSYQVGDAVIYTLLTAPSRIYEFFPMSVVIGGMLGLGALASHSELTILRAAGISTVQIAGSVMRAALILMVLVFLLGEYVAPSATKMADNLRSMQIHGRETAQGREGIWLKNGTQFIRVGKVGLDSSLRDVQFFEFDASLRQLLRVYEAKAVIHVKDTYWVLQDVKGSQIEQDEIRAIAVQQQDWRDAFTPDKLGIVKLKPESLNIIGLQEYITYMDMNQLDSRRFQLAFWRKISAPLSIAVMLLLSLSFIFGPLRSGTMGAKILVGVLAGFAFDISSRIFGDTALVYNLPAFVGAFTPLVFFGAGSLFLMRKAG